MKMRYSMSGMVETETILKPRNQKVPFIQFDAVPKIKSASRFSAD